MKYSEYIYSIDESLLIKRPEDEFVYDLYSPTGRRKYFDTRVGKEIKALHKYLKDNTFIGYLLSTKMAGKGSYANQLKEAIGDEYFEVISVGDLVRTAEREYLDDGEVKSSLYAYTLQNYRGLMSIDDVFRSLTKRSTSNLSVPTDFVLMLIKREIDRIGHKSIFIDGFPRSIDQVSFSLYLRDLVNYRNDPDCFIFINLPMTVVDVRIKDRIVCPVCRNSRNVEFNPTSIAKLDTVNNEIYFECDNPACIDKHIRMERKEGDEKGIELIKDRINTDLDVMDIARQMYGIPKIELSSSLETSNMDEYTFDYERTKSWKHKVINGKVVSTKQEYVFSEHGKTYCTVTPPWVVVNFIRYLAEFCGLQ